MVNTEAKTNTEGFCCSWPLPWILKHEPLFSVTSRMFGVCETWLLKQQSHRQLLFLSHLSLLFLCLTSAVLSVNFAFHRTSRRGWTVLTRTALSSSPLALEWSTCQKTLPISWHAPWPGCPRGLSGGKGSVGATWGGLEHACFLLALQKLELRLPGWRRQYDTPEKHSAWKYCNILVTRRSSYCCGRIRHGLHS